MTNSAQAADCPPAKVWCAPYNEDICTDMA